MKKEKWKILYRCIYCKKESKYTETKEPNSTWYVSFQCKHCKRMSEKTWIDNLMVTWSKL